MLTIKKKKLKYPRRMCAFNFFRTQLTRVFICHSVYCAKFIKKIMYPELKYPGMLTYYDSSVSVWPLWFQYFNLTSARFFGFASVLEITDLFVMLGCLVVSTARWKLQHRDLSFQYLKSTPTSDQPCWRNLPESATIVFIASGYASCQNYLLIISLLLLP